MNIWNKIPLDDYEKHMSHPSVGQLGLLSEILKEKLSEYKPATLIIWGIAGGNGLEHVDNTITKKVIGIDINQSYLEECRKRFNLRIPDLNLFQYDLNNSIGFEEKASLIWGALILEYIDINVVFRNTAKSLEPNGIFSVILQRNNGVKSISDTHVESIKEIGHIFKIVNPKLFRNKAEENGFKIISEKEYQLGNGKSFISLDLKHEA